VRNQDFIPGKFYNINIMKKKEEKKEKIPGCRLCGEDVLPSLFRRDANLCARCDRERTESLCGYDGEG